MIGSRSAAVGRVRAAVLTASWSGAGVRAADAVAAATSRLSEAHIAVPRVDAEWLVAFVLGVPRGRLPVAADLTPEQVTRLAGLVNDRAARVPLQHLTGMAPFRRLEMAVGAGVFVPRPETEVLVDWGLGWLARRPEAGRGAVVVDLCAGSGAVAASVAAEAPGTRVYAVESDPAALVWLRRNVAELAVASASDGDGDGASDGDGDGASDGDGVTVVAGDATAADVLAELDGCVDLVLANPPYVPQIAAASLPPEVTGYDPPVALFAGTDGLDVIRPLIGRVAALLRLGGAFAVEHDETHAYVVPTLVDADGRFTDVRLHHDLAMRPRFTTATRSRPGNGRSHTRKGRVAHLPP